MYIFYSKILINLLKFQKKNKNIIKGGEKFKKILKIALCILAICLVVLCKIINKTENKKTEDNNTTQATYINTQNINEPYQSQEEWKIEIPQILLIANISNGTDKETLDKFVGHFELTPKKEGNICLAGHNRGYPVNYFANLKYLKGGEEIIYTYGSFKKTYVVDKNIKISETDWSYLENSNENKITLITCVENEPEYRRCVQATEREET